MSEQSPSRSDLHVSSYVSSSLFGNSDKVPDFYQSLFSIEEISLLCQRSSDSFSVSLFPSSFVSHTSFSLDISLLILNAFFLSLLVVFLKFSALILNQTNFLLICISIQCIFHQIPIPDNFVEYIHEQFLSDSFLLVD